MSPTIMNHILEKSIVTDHLNILNAQFLSLFLKEYMNSHIPRIVPIEPIHKITSSSAGPLYFTTYADTSDIIIKNVAMNIKIPFIIC